jgi:hypothetical protein
MPCDARGTLPPSSSSEPNSNHEENPSQVPVYKVADQYSSALPRSSKTSLNNCPRPESGKENKMTKYNEVCWVEFQDRKRTLGKN